MVAYEYYGKDEIGRVHFIGIIPERSGTSERITGESNLNLAKMILGKDAALAIYFLLK